MKAKHKSLRTQKITKVISIGRTADKQIPGVFKIFSAKRDLSCHRVQGNGKTSFVNHVLNKYTAESNNKKIISIHLTIAQNNPKEADILQLIVTSVYDKYLRYLAETNRFKKGSLKKRMIFKSAY